MKPMIISINPADRLVTRVLSRSADEAVDELRQCITAMNLACERLAREYPGCVGVAIFAGGVAPGALVYAPSEEGCHFSPVVMDRVDALADFISLMPELLLDRFQFRFDFLMSQKKLLAEMEVAVTAALAAANDQ